MYLKAVPHCLFVLIAIFATTAISAELLTNPGFENNTTGWNSINGENSWISILTTAHSGAKSADFTTYDTTAPLSGYEYVWQTVAANGSSEYTLSVYARDYWSSASGGFMVDAVTLKLEYYDAGSTLLRTDQRLFALAKDYQWHQYFLTATNIPAGTVSIKSVIGTGKNLVSILFDDASLTGRTITPPQPHTGDLNNDLYVNFEDFAMLAGNWRQSADWDDLLATANNWLTNYSGVVTIAPSAQTIGKYGYVSFDINSASSYFNPYNPDDIRIDIAFEDPNGISITLPCFYVSGNSGNSHWQGRFTPRKTGQYSYQAKVFVNGSVDSLSNVFNLTVEDSNKNGFIHLNPQSNYSFLYDSGKPFRGIGEDVAWDPRPQGSGDNSAYTYEYMFPLLGANGCNFARVWICQWNRSMPLEWVSPGLGRYDEAAAARIDTILSLAEQNGIYLMLTLDGTGALASLPDYWGSSGHWPYNPYNVVNGGPCATAAAFFSNSTAKAFYKKRLRYIIARWGYNPHLGVIELYNEIDGAYQDGDADVPAADIVSWHSEMSTYLKSIDPFGHLVSTSAGYKTIPGLFNVSNLDFSQSHPYGPPYGPSDSIYNKIVSSTNTYGKPYVAGEFGYDWRGPNSGYGTQSDFERELRLGMWRGMFSPTPVVPLNWFWDAFADWNDWYIFNAAGKFCSELFPNGGGVLQQDTAYAGTNIEIMSLRNGTAVFVWMRNKTTSTVSGAALSVYSLPNGSYEVRYYDTLAGTYSSPTTVSVTTGTLSSSIPSLTADKDIACRIVKIN